MPQRVGRRRVRQAKRPSHALDGKLDDSRRERAAFHADEQRAVRRQRIRAKPQVKGDPEEIKTAISNIIINAAESMPDGGEIYITTEESGGYSHIYFLDSGKGIPEQLRDVIFDPCFSTKGGNSMGLGLSVWDFG